uniref:Protein smg n=1 Tax=Anthurium amnicola TaxID=1678845 RepID=A0A1D1XH72_9ARAE
MEPSTAMYGTSATSSEEEYLSFVRMRPTLQDNQYSEPLPPQREDKNSEPDADEEYQMFLDHLREDDCSYVFEMPPVYVKYEEEGEPIGANVTETKGDPRQWRYVGCEEKQTNSQAGRKMSPSNTIGHLKLGAIDPRYQEFLRRLRVRGDSVFLKLDQGITVKYGEERSPNASVTTEATHFPFEEPEFHNNSSVHLDSFIPVFEDDGTSAENSRVRKIPYFEKELKSLCDKKFDQEEYEYLLNEVSTHKQVERCKHLRGVTKIYQTREMAKSYFDHHPDFSERIRTACCLTHRLKQLRGFLFWLKNLCHEGAFKPWEAEHFNICENCG